MAERLIGVGDEQVLVLDGFHHRPLVLFQHGMRQHIQLGKEEIFAIRREGKEVFHIVIASPGNEGVVFLDVHFFHDHLEETRRHLAIIDQPRGPSPLALLQHPLHLPHVAIGKIVVHIELGIAGNLEGVGVYILILKDVENLVEVMANDVVHIHDIAVGQLDKTGQLRWYFQNSVALFLAAHHHRQVEGTIRKLRERLGLMTDQGHQTG